MHTNLTTNRSKSCVLASPNEIRTTVQSKDLFSGKKIKGKWATDGMKPSSKRESDCNLGMTLPNKKTTGFTQSEAVTRAWVQNQIFIPRSNFQKKIQLPSALTLSSNQWCFASPRDPEAPPTNRGTLDLKSQREPTRNKKSKPLFFRHLLSSKNKKLNNWELFSSTLATLAR